MSDRAASQKPFAGVVEHAEDVPALPRFDQDRIPVAAGGAVFPHGIHLHSFFSTSAVLQGAVCSLSLAAMERRSISKQRDTQTWQWPNQ